MDDFNILDSLESNINVKKIGIREFAESPKFCGKFLYPRQRLFLKMFFLEELDDFEEGLLDDWIDSPEINISPGIRERMAWLKDRGYPHFREVVLVGGRRSSKGFLTGIILAKKLYDTLQLQDPNLHYGVDTNKEIYFSCVAASEKQAKELQYADFANTVNACRAMQPFIYKVQELEFSVHTEADRRRLAEWKRMNRRVQRDISKLRGKALPANSRTLRGYTSMAYCFDEMAHFMQGESDQADEEVYEAATPSLAQFGRDGLIFCNSSPYAKTGKFYQRFEEGMATDNGAPLTHNMFSLQFPSWAMYEGWWEDPSYRGDKKCQTASPDWDPERKKEGSNELFYSLDDRQNILVERDNERQNPTKFKVERRGKFAEVMDAYLMPEQVDRMFAGRPVEGGQGYTPLKTNWNDSTYLNKYKAHLDPSSTTAGFGFALGHVEEITINGRTGQHVIFDIIKRWNPKEFPEGVIDWEGVVLPEVMYYIDIFRPYELTMDQFQSAAPIQWLRRNLRAQGINETRVYEKTATATYNWNRAEVFKTALYQGVLHAPYDTDDTRYASEELKYLQEVRTGRIPRVDKQDLGPVQTKDMADCMMEVTEALIGNIIANSTREDLAASPLAGSPGGYQIGGPGGGGEHGSPFADLYGRRTGEQSGFGGSAFQRRRPGRGRDQGGSPARNPYRGRPVPQRISR